jgi:Ca-activated chloride channel family protein
MIEKKEYLFLLFFLIFLPLFIKKIIYYFKLFKDKQTASNFNFRFGIKSIINFTLKITVIVLLIIALAGPLKPDKKMKKFGKGTDIVFVVDISKSMLTEDIKPNRLESAKAFINEMVTGLSFDRVGLVLFADKAIFYCPLTTDYDAISSFVNDINCDLMPSGGSSLKSGIEKGIFAIKRDEKNKSGNLIILSDGEDLENEDYSDCLKKAEKNKFNIYTIGVGTKEGGKIPEHYRDFFISKKRYKKYRGQYIISKLNEKFLKDIAQRSSGKYFSLNNMSAKKMNRILLNNSEKKLNKRDFFLMKNIYHKYLFIAFILYLIAALLIIL